MMDQGSLRSPLGRVIGLGSAKEGVEHWWHQRLTAIALVPLTLWFVVSLIAHLGGDYSHAVQWIGAPVPAILMVLLIGTGFYHAMLGMQVVIEDYVHHEWVKLTALILLRMACFLLGVAGIFSVLHIAFKG
jgi:succinate dehydrogenase / fumarate reductase membrane anchor subunit